MTFKLSRFLTDHPLESLFAVALLFALLFATEAPQPLPAGTQIAASEKN